MVVPRPSFLVLEPNVPVRVRVRDFRTETREIRDPRTGQVKELGVLVLEVSEVNGEPRQTTLSFTAFKAQQTLAPLLNSGLALRRELEIVRRPAGFATEYEVRVL